MIEIASAGRKRLWFSGSVQLGLLPSRVRLPSMAQADCDYSFGVNGLNENLRTGTAHGRGFVVVGTLR